MLPTPAAATAELDTFDNPAPEPTVAEVKAMSADTGPVPGDDESDDGKDEQPKPDLKEVSQTDALDEEEDKTEEAEKTTEQPKETVSEEVKEPEAPAEKTIRVKHGDEATDIPEDATIKVKVNGKSEFRTLKELQESYSGTAAWSAKVSEANRKEEYANDFYEQVKAEKAEINGHMTKIAQMLDDQEADPMTALLYLVDLSGRNVHDFTKRVYDYTSKTVEQLSQMDEVEQRLYWKERELGYLRDNQAAKEREQQQRDAHRDAEAKVYSLMESQGVSEDQYVQAYNELRWLGYAESDVTPQAAVAYAVMKPHLDRADAIALTHQADLDDDQTAELVDGIANVLRRNPELSDDEAATIAARQLGWGVETDETVAQRIGAKVASRDRVRPAVQHSSKTNTNRAESFDDLDEQFYGRRR